MDMARAAGLEIRLIGPMALLRDGAPTPLPGSRKTRALLGYLIVAGRPVSRDRLCELFWDLPDDPRGSLRWNLSQLRKMLGAEAAWLETDRERVALRAPADRIDWLRLRRAAEAGDPDPAALAPLAAIEGELLEGLDLPGCDSYQSWLVAQREDHRRRRAALLAKLVESDPDPERRLAHARALTELRPHSPEAWEALIGVLRDAGRNAEAEQQREIAVRRIEEAGEPVPTALRYRGRAGASGAGAAASAPRQQIRFCRAPDGTSLAWAEAGEGPALVKTANWMTHLELDWQNPVWKHWFDALSEGRRFIRYDQRGNGLSDWKVKFGFAAFVDDLASVVEAAGLDRFDLFGVSQGAAVAVAYAVANPERVRRMVLFGGFPVGWAGGGSAEDKARQEAMLTLTAQGWSGDNPAYRQIFTSLLVPEASTGEQDAFNEMQRRATSAENAAEIQRSNAAIDVRDLLEKVAVPTLVAHCRGDAMVPFEGGRALAGGIPGARFLALDSRNHLILEREPAWAPFIAEVRAFLDAED